jgi:hypothetical protein
MKIQLQDLLENYSFNVAPLLTAREFIDLAHKCGLIGPLSSELLEFLEKERLFLPMARIMYGPVWYNVERSEKEHDIKDDKGNFWKLVSRCKENSDWKGDTIDIYKIPHFDKRTLDILNDEKLIDDPHNDVFKPWKEYEDNGIDRKGDCYYSIFQLYHLKQVLDATRTSFHASVFFSDEFNKYIQDKKIIFNQHISHYRTEEPVLHQQSLLLQLIADRFLPYAQTDQIKIHYSTSNFEFSLRDLKKNWDSKLIVQKYGIGPEELEKIRDQFVSQANYIDPISAWHELTVFMPWEKKKQLKGDALLAQYLHNHEFMLRKFYEDAFNVELKAPYCEYFTTSEFNHGVTDEESALPYRQYVFNRYSLNTTPRVILLVEGNSEEKFFPAAIEKIFGRQIAQTGIHIWNVKGVDQFCGNKKVNEKPFERFIDFNQSINGTIVYSVFDDEGSISKVFKNLKNKDSDFNPECKITYEEYIWIWKQTFEFDNFTDTEIAKAMTLCSESRFLFKDEEIALCRIGQKKSRNDTLSILYKEKLNYELNKPQLGKLLLTNYIEEIIPYYEECSDLRPFIEVIRMLLKLAYLNVPPVFEKQKEGFINIFFSNDEEIKRNRRAKFFNEEKNSLLKKC